MQVVHLEGAEGGEGKKGGDWGGMKWSPLAEKLQAHLACGKLCFQSHPLRGSRILLPGD